MGPSVKMTIPCVFRYVPTPVTENLLDELAREQPLFQPEPDPAGAGVELPGSVGAEPAAERAEETGGQPAAQSSGEWARALLEFAVKALQIWMEESVEN